MDSRLWSTYFTLNAAAARGILWEAGADLPGNEVRVLVPSIQEFQLGENSDGVRLRAAASAWAARHRDPSFSRAIDLFIAEEQRHAAELARFLILNGHPVLAHSVGDAAFRTLRHLTGGLEVSLTVLMTAEIIGYVYYGALRSATRSQVLKSICDAFLRDEAAHLVFHAGQLARMRRGRASLALKLTRALSGVLLLGACSVVWLRHREVLRRDRLGLSAFIASCLDRLGRETARASAPAVLHPRDAAAS